MALKPWTAEQTQRAIELWSEGASHNVVADRIGRTRGGVKRKYESIAKMGLLKKRTRLEYGGKPTPISAYNDALITLPKKFNEFMRITVDNAMVISDPHLPFVDWDLVDKCMKVGKAQQVKTLCIVGDVFDLQMFSTFPDAGKHGKDALQEAKHAGIQFFGKLLTVFDRIYVVSGNHDFRIFRFSEGKITDDVMFDYLTGCMREGRIKFSAYRHMVINDKWRLVHPDGHQSDFVLEGRGECSKYLQNIVVAHVHRMGWCYDASGNYVVIGCGAMLDPETIDYYNLKSSKSPVWNTGFAMVQGDTFHLFPKDRTNWDMWTKKKII